MELLTAAITVFLLLDPIGNIPIFLSVMKSIPPERYTRIVLREMLIALFVMLFFLFAGRYVLMVLQLSQAAIQLSGAVVLFLIALNMAFPSNNMAIANGNIEGEPFIVPLAIPLVAGPSTLAVLMLVTSDEPEKLFTWVAALCISWAIALAVLLTAVPISRVLGKKGMLAMERLIGMLLIMVAIQMLLDGIASALKDLSW